MGPGRGRALPRRYVSGSPLSRLSLDVHEPRGRISAGALRIQPIPGVEACLPRLTPTPGSTRLVVPSTQRASWSGVGLCSSGLSSPKSRRKQFLSDRGDTAHGALWFCRVSVSFLGLCCVLTPLRSGPDHPRCGRPGPTTLRTPSPDPRSPAPEARSEPAGALLRAPLQLVQG